MSKTIQMPALSPTMEEGTLAKWLVKEGDTVSSGDLLAEIETDKATMEFEAVDEGIVAKILVAEGAEGVKVGTVIAIIAEEGEDVATAAAAADGASADAAPVPKADPVPAKAEAAAPAPKADAVPAQPAAAAAPASEGRVKASPLARRLAEAKGVDLGTVAGSGPNGRIVKADLDGAAPTA
ncbi:branched-chain alpha-keto acid dehydrogenase subunit E2, partial [Sphingobium sp. C100]|uniref:biotin/lipoyl-containing protein n=1 Tax=Sphingobium sp. C100 TaxID=1207055 RepID=UPI0003D5D527